MSEYNYDDRPRRRDSRRTREREPEYVQETAYIERGGKGAPVRDLVYRPREDSIEDIPRDFPPPGAEYRQSKYRERDIYEPQRTRSVGGRRSYDDRSDYGYPPSSRGGRPRRSDYDRDGYYSDDYDEKPRRERRKSVVDGIKETAEGLGLGGVIAAVTGKKSRSRSRPRHGGRDDDDDDRYDRRSRRYSDDDRYDRRSRRYSDESRSGSRSRTEKKWEQAAKAAVVAGAIEAFRSRKEPGPWTGEKGQRVATAALGAAGINSLVDKDPDKKGKRHVAEAAIGGLIANRLANGSRSQSRGRGRDGSRSRSRSRSTGGGLRSRSRSLFGRGRSQSRGRDGEDKSHTLRNAAGAGAVLAAGKALYDRVRSKSRSRKERDRSRSVSSEDSYVPSRGRNYSHRRSRDMESFDGASAVTKKSHRGGKGHGSSGSDSESTTDMENKRKKLRGKELLTAGFATVATIHAAHGVYSSMVASEKRRKLVGEGEMSPEEARKRKSRNMLQDAAAVGIAALGIKSAFSEWKEMNEHRHTVKELEAKRRKRRKARERREQEARESALGGRGGAAPVMNEPYANAYPAYPTAPRQQAYPTTYADANPYGSVPPPPIGAPPAARY